MQQVGFFFLFFVEKQKS